MNWGWGEHLLIFLWRGLRRRRWKSNACNEARCFVRKGRDVHHIDARRGRGDGRGGDMFVLHWRCDEEV